MIGNDQLTQFLLDKGIPFPRKLSEYILIHKFWFLP